MSNRAVAVQKLRWSGMLEMYKGVGDSLCHFGNGSGRLVERKEYENTTDRQTSNKM